MPLKPLHDAGRLTRVIATSYQAVSGRASGAWTSCGADARLGPRRIHHPGFFDHQIAFNVIPHIDKFVEGGYTGEEMKLVHEVRKISKPRPSHLAHHGARPRVHRALRGRQCGDGNRGGPERARELFSSFPGLTLWDDPRRSAIPCPCSSRARMTATFGRIRQDLSRANALNFWVVGDQLRKGAALNGIQIAELLIR